jgi:hypothetical protein
MNTAELFVGLRLKEQKANAAAENQKKCRDSNRYPKKSIESPPTPQEMFTQNDGNMTRCQRTDAISSAPRGDTMTPIEKMMWKQGSLTSCSAESLTAFEWTSPFESGYALLNGHA